MEKTARAKTRREGQAWRAPGGSCKGLHEGRGGDFGPRKEPRSFGKWFRLISSSSEGHVEVFSRDVIQNGVYASEGLLHPARMEGCRRWQGGRLGRKLIPEQEGWAGLGHSTGDALGRRASRTSWQIGCGMRGKENSRMIPRVFALSN